jgi:cytochrome P450
MGRTLRAIEQDLDVPRPSARLELLDAVAAIDVPFVRRVIARRPVVFINDPELIAQVLVARADSFEKSEFQRRVMGVAEGSETGLGNGLLTSANATNKAQRKLLGRVFSPAATRRYVREMAALAREERERWQDGATVELGAAFMRLSARIVARTLFSWDIAPADQRIVDDLALIGSLLGRSADQRRAGWQDPSVIERAAATIEGRLLSLVAARRRAGGGGAAADAPDVIDLLLQAQAEGVGSADYVVSDRQIRDDLMTLFITGAENPCNALTWTLYLLSRHPDAALRIRDEIAAASATGGDVTPETLQRLPYTLQVYKEALRLYPPGYAFGRRAMQDLQLGPLRLEKDTEVVVSPYALHRRPTLFERPGEFDPARFDERREAERHPCAFLPFGAGPRACVGGGFALLQGQVVLAVLLGGLRFTPASNNPVLPEPRMTLRPAGPVSVIVHREPPSG